jgi:hypothetical protein
MPSSHRGNADCTPELILRACAEGMSRADLLDDWGPDRFTANQRRDLMEIIEDRYDRGVTSPLASSPSTSGATSSRFAPRVRAAECHLIEGAIYRSSSGTLAKFVAMSSASSRVSTSA